MIDRRRVLRWSQIVVNVVIIVLSMCICLPLGYVWKYFDSNCLLNADVYVVESQNSTIQVLADETVWGDSSQCLYTIFLPVVVAIHAFVWTWFFICLRIALKENRRDTYLALPVVVLHGILCICMIVSSFIVTLGFAAMCNKIQKNLKSKYTCEEYQNQYWAMFAARKRSFYTFFVMGQVCSWLLTVALAAQCAVTLYKSYLEWHWELLYPEKEDKQPLDTGNGQCGPYPGLESDTGSLTSSVEGRESLQGSMKTSKSKPI